MGLSKKTFLYSIVLAILVVASVTGYFVFMLPSLYVDYVMDSNLDSVSEIQKGYMAKRSYDELSVKNPSAVFSLEIPNQGNEIYAAGKFFKLTIAIRDEELKDVLEVVRERFTHQKETQTGGGREALDQEEREKLADLWKIVREKVSRTNPLSEELPFSVHVESKNHRGIYKEEYTKTHMVTDSILVHEMGVSDGDYEYTTYIALSHVGDAAIITVLPAMTPQMGEITPVVMGSVPMITAVVFLLVLIASRYFSRRIVNPVIRLADYAEAAKTSGVFEPDSFVPDTGDEIGMLGRTLYELYGKLQENYQELEQKNLALAGENERQEVFLKSSSHQLKTPITAALLLVDGMMNEVGKYKSTKEYLPEVKKQLLMMRQIVSDTLYLNYHGDAWQEEEVSLGALLQELIHIYELTVADKNLRIQSTGDMVVVTSKEMLKKILDNLISNAVQYTPPGERIEIKIGDGRLCMINHGVTIDETLLPNIFAPFVSGASDLKGKGLGLYVASYYSRILGYHLTISNGENCVCAKLDMGKGGEESC